MSDLLHSEERLLNTRKESCFFDRDGELEIFKNAHKSTLAHKVYLKMNKSDPCFIETNGATFSDTLTRKKVEKIFWLGLDIASAFLAKIVQFFGRTDTYLNETPIWQSPRALILRRSLDRAFKKYFNLALTLYSEYGFFTKGFRDFPISIVLGGS